MSKIENDVTKSEFFLKTKKRIVDNEFEYFINKLPFIDEKLSLIILEEELKARQEKNVSLIMSDKQIVKMWINFVYEIIGLYTKTGIIGKDKNLSYGAYKYLVK